MNTPLLSNVDTAGRDVQAHIVSDISIDLLNYAVQDKLAALWASGYDVVHKVEFSPGDMVSTCQLVVSGDPMRVKQIADMKARQAYEEGRWLSDKTSNTGRFFDTPLGAKPSVIRGSPNEIIARVMNALEGKVEPGSFVPLSTLAEWTDIPAGRIRSALACYPPVYNGDTVSDAPPRFLMTGDPEDESSLGYALNPEWVRYSTPQKRGGEA